MPNTATQKVILWAIIALVLIGITVLFVPRDGEKKPDSGVVACEEMRNNVESGRASDPNKKLTAEQYKEVRQKFEKSHYPDIQEAGIRLVDTVVRAESTSNQDIGGNLQIIVDLSTDMGEVRIACANHGVYIPAQGS